MREAIDLLLGTGDAAAIDAASVCGYERVPPPGDDPWAREGALAAITRLSVERMTEVCRALALASGCS